MAINFRMNDNKLDEIEELKMHYMPCKIDGDETANVTTYFESYIRKTDEDNLEASFRGYPLKGKEISMPENYRGITVSEYRKPDSENETRNLHITGIFQKFTFWNYDKIPSNNDAFKKALNWIDIAKALHSNDDEDGTEEETIAEVIDVSM